MSKNNNVSSTNICKKINIRDLSLYDLAEEIISGRRLDKDDDLDYLLECNLDDLKSGADVIRKHFKGEKVNLCTIINGRSGKCGENCKFCAQSVHNNSSCEIYDLLDEEIIIKRAKSDESEGVSRFAIVNSGHHPSTSDFEKILNCIKNIRKECRIDLCVSLGFLSEEQFKRLKKAGVKRIHNNIETSKNNFPNICTSHTFQDKINNIKRAKEAGLAVCSGGIIGLGETWQDRIDMALCLSELKIDSIPINSLMPIQGTPLGKNKRLSEEDILRTIAIFRYINPDADIRLAGGRALMKDHGLETFRSGASATITGNMLTTSGSTIASDKAMLKDIGRDVTPE
jgi:biotin synthase